MGDDLVRQEIQQAHDEAVADAMGYLERNALRTRRGAGGKEVIETKGFIGAAFRHRTSRAGDPDLHTHVAVANLVQGVDGAWRTIHTGLLYNHAKTTGVVYQARLRYEVTQRLGLEFDEVKNGYADLKAVPEEMRQQYSKRRAEILANLRANNRSGVKAAQMAAYATRARKTTLATEPASLHDTWRNEATDMGYSMDEMLSADRQNIHSQFSADMFANLGGDHGLTEQKTNFSRRDVLQGLASQMPYGATAEWLESQADVFLGSHFVEKLDGAGLTNAEVLRRKDGRIVATAATEPRYAATDLLMAERRIFAEAQARKKSMSRSLLN